MVFLDQSENYCVRTGAKSLGGESSPNDSCCGPDFPFMKPFNSNTHKCSEDFEIIFKNEVNWSGNE